jgi:hypothetical protein
VPHALQLMGSSLIFTQAPLQFVSGEAHVAAHLLPEHA